MCTYCWRQIESRGYIPLVARAACLTKLNSIKCPRVNIYYTKIVIHWAVSTPENGTTAFLSVITFIFASSLRNQHVIVSSLHMSSQNSVTRSNECRQRKKDDHGISPPSVRFPTPFLLHKMPNIQCQSAWCLSLSTSSVRSDAHCSMHLLGYIIGDVRFFMHSHSRKVRLIDLKWL